MARKRNRSRREEEHGDKYSFLFDTDADPFAGEADDPFAFFGDDEAQEDFTLGGMFALDADENPLQQRILKPRITVFDSKNITRKNAKKFAKEIKINKGYRADAIVSGSFVFGDFFEEYLRVHNLTTPRITFATLSLSKDNIDSIARMLNEGIVGEVLLIFSAYFYSCEARTDGLIPYIFEALDKDDRLQIAVAGSHIKVTLFEDSEGNKIVCHGSANLRSSANIEQICVEENPALFDFYTEAFDKIVERYHIIEKPIRHGQLYNLIDTTL